MGGARSLGWLTCVLDLLHRKARGIADGGQQECKKEHQKQEQHHVHVLCMALHHLCTVSLDLRRAIKAVVFPPALDHLFEDGGAIAGCSPAAAGPGAVLAGTCNVADRRMHPDRGHLSKEEFAMTLRGQLILLMISINTDLKRAAAELLFILCDEAQEEFTRRCGFGSAVALLQLKGLA